VLDTRGDIVPGATLEIWHTNNAGQYDLAGYRYRASKLLTTQLYFATDPVFDGDPDRNYAKDPLIQSRELVRPVVLRPKANNVTAAVTFEIVLERA
jgi:protocatechuate 3,4-dioxygenase beta subunit